MGEAISLQRQVFQTASVASSDSNHTNSLLWLFPRTERYSSRSYLCYLCSYMLLSKLCCYWFLRHCWVWFSAPFDLTLLFCSSSCLSFYPQLCVGLISKNASRDIETKSVVTPDIQCRPWQRDPPHLHIAFERMKKGFTMLTYALPPQIYINTLLIWMGWAAPLHTSVASPLQMPAWSWMNNGSFGSVAELKTEEKHEGNNSADKIKKAFWQSLNSELSILAQPEKFCLTQNSIFLLIFELNSPAVDVLTLILKSLYNGAFHFCKTKDEKIYFWTSKLHSSLSFSPMWCPRGFKKFLFTGSCFFSVQGAWYSGKVALPPARAICSQRERVGGCFMTCKYSTSLCGHTIPADTAPQDGAKPCALSWHFARHTVHKELRNSNVFRVSYTCKLSPRKLNMELQTGLRWAQVDGSPGCIIKAMSTWTRSETGLWWIHRDPVHW